MSHSKEENCIFTNGTLLPLGDGCSWCKYMKCIIADLICCHPERTKNILEKCSRSSEERHDIIFCLECKYLLYVKEVAEICCYCVKICCIETIFNLMNEEYMPINQIDMIDSINRAYELWNGGCISDDALTAALRVFMNEGLLLKTECSLNGESLLVMAKNNAKFSEILLSVLSDSQTY
jgi:hypothetical protein